MQLQLHETSGSAIPLDQFFPVVFATMPTQCSSVRGKVKNSNV